MVSDLWALGVAHGAGLDVSAHEVDVAPVQIQRPKAKDVLVDQVGARVLDVPYYGLMEARIDGLDVVVSRTGYTGEVGYEIYLREARENGMRLWDTVLGRGRYR